ncbi:MAG: methyltransferase domain-containing protein [Chromatocurvus sp.]
MLGHMSDFYDTHAPKLSADYNAMRPEDVHAAWLPLLHDQTPGFACDIGAGSGRDANWLAEKGWDVIAVEPSAGMRAQGEASSHPNVTWLDDSLPELRKLRAMGHRFDLILLSAVWMHVAPGSRERAFRSVTELLKPGGTLVITLRHGSDEDENRRRGFHPVSAEELEHCARQRALVVTRRERWPDTAGRKHVSWETVVFVIPDDGTGSLPLLRHVIVNDRKSSSYKLGLLRVLTRIAEGLPGIVIQRTDDYVDIPFGVVGLYWLKLYKPLVLQHGVQVTNNTRLGMGFAGEAFYQLESFSGFDLRLGGGLDAERGEILTEAIRDACSNIRKMPVRHTTWPGTENPLFAVEPGRLRRRREPVTVSPAYLAQFGTMRIPVAIWQTLGQYACWLEPAIIREWVSLTDSWSVGGGAIDARLLEWEEGRRDTRIANDRVLALRDAGKPVRCVWSDHRLRVAHIDHCFPWSRWLNNDLWNLVPSRADVNLGKGDRLPSAATLSLARTRIEHWWQTAYLDSPWRERFLLEAASSLPGISDTPGVQDIYHAMRHQRARLKADQQLAEWTLGGND